MEKIICVTCIIHDHRVCKDGEWPGGFFTADFYTGEIVATTDEPVISLDRYRNSVYGLSPFHVGGKHQVEREMRSGHFIRSVFNQKEQTVTLAFFTDVPE